MRATYLCLPQRLSALRMLIQARPTNWDDAHGSRHILKASQEFPKPAGENLGIAFSLGFLRFLRGILVSLGACFRTSHDLENLEKKPPPLSLWLAKPKAISSTLSVLL